MGERIKLYPDPPKLALELAEPGAHDGDCRRCPLRETHRADPEDPKDKTTLANVVQADVGSGAGPTLLVVVGGPGSHEDLQGKPFVGPVGQHVRPLLTKGWPGRIVVDSATRCFRGRGKDRKEVEEEHVAACRPFLAGTRQAVKPARVVALGEQAIQSVLGRSVNALNSRRGYTWLWNAGDPVPVFFVLGPEAGHRNRFLRRFFEEDLRWALAAAVPRPAHLGPEFCAHMVSTPEEAACAAAELQRGEGFAFDLEWAGYLWDKDFRLLTASAAPVGRPGLWVWDEEALADEALFGPLRELLEDPEVPKGGSNVKADQSALWCGKKVRVRGITFDTRLERKLLEPDATANLEDMAELVGMGGHKAEAQDALDAIEKRIRKMAEGKRKKRASAQKSLGFGDFDASAPLDAAVRLGYDLDVEKYADHPLAIAYAFLEKDTLHRYVARDTLTTARLASLLSLRLHRSPERQRIWERVILPAAGAIQRVEEWGVPFDAQAGVLFRELMVQGLEAAHAKVQQYAEPGRPLNPGSPQQLAAMLYGKLKLEAPYKTDGGVPSTDEGALLQLRASGHPLPGYVLEYRHYQKLIGYADDWARCVRADGRIHPSIHLDGARSGRASISDPSLQNVPRAADSEDGKRARDCFAAPRGKVLVQLDQSQVELRVAAYLSRDSVMASLFRSGVDFHMGTARLISKLAWGIEPDQVQKPHRTSAKAVNFALCVAAGQMVLTDVGLVPIEAVEDWHRVWDGLEWVSHEGVVFRGFKEVVTYDGLTATPDHEVYIDADRKVRLEEALGHSRRITVGGTARGAVRLPASYGASRKENAKPEIRRGDLRYLLQEALGLGGQCTWAKDDELYMPAQVRRGLEGAHVGPALRRNGAAVPSGYARFLAQLQGTWHQGLVQIARRIRALGFGEVAVAGGLQGQGPRPNGQQWALLDGQPAAGYPLSKSKKRTALAPVYDLINAGPRRRFTVSGKLVSNCYGKTAKTLGAELGISTEQAKGVVDAIFGKFSAFHHWSRQSLAYAKERGGVWTSWEGEDARWRPLWRIADESEDGARAASTARNGAVNSRVQGTSSDICMAGLTKVVALIEAGEIDAEVVLPIHDSILMVCPEKTWRDSALAARHAMVDFPWFTDFVPLEVDAEAGDRWGSLEHVDLG